MKKRSTLITASNYTSGALEISIVLASVSVVTRVHALGIAAGAIGLLACGYGLAVLTHAV